MRNARVRIIELRNDLKAVTDDIAKVLAAVYDASAAPAPASGSDGVEMAEEEDAKPFARVDGVAPSSPAAVAVCAEIYMLPFHKTHVSVSGNEKRGSCGQVWTLDKPIIRVFIVTNVGRVGGR